MPAYRLDIPPQEGELLRHLPSDPKRAIKSALQALGRGPALGEPRVREPERRWKYRVRRIRIMCSVDRGSRGLRIFAVGRRRAISETVATWVRSREG